MDPLCAHLGALAPLFPEVFDSQFGFGSKTLNRKKSGSFVFVFIIFNLFLFCLQSKGSLCSPGTPFVDQADLKLGDPPDSSSRVPGLPQLPPPPGLV